MSARIGNSLSVAIGRRGPSARCPLSQLAAASPVFQASDLAPLHARRCARRQVRRRQVRRREDGHEQGRQGRSVRSDGQRLQRKPGQGVDKDNDGSLDANELKAMHAIMDGGDKKKGAEGSCGGDKKKGAEVPAAARSNARHDESASAHRRCGTRPAAGPSGSAADDSQQASAIDFFEIAPENWNRRRRQARSHAAQPHRTPCVRLSCLSLSLGGRDPLDETLLAKIRRLLDAHGIATYSEHLSYCADEGHLYDLMPIPFTDEAVHHVAARIRQTQDILGQRIAVETFRTTRRQALRFARSTSSKRY